MKRALVTGASGFVGTHLLEELSELGITTTALYFSKYPESERSESNKSIHWVRCDLTKENIESHLVGVDTVFHLAGYAGLGSDAETRSRLENLNVGATGRLASQVLKAGVRIIYVSSVHACDNGVDKGIIDELTGPPKTEYGRSKLRAERLLYELGESGLDFTILRPTQIFGEYHEGSVVELVKAIGRRRFFLIGDGKNFTNFLYVKDFVHTLIQVAENRACRGKTYVVSDEPLALASLVNEICTHLNARPMLLKLPRALGMLVGLMCDILANRFGTRLPLSRQRIRAMTRDVQFSNQRLLADIGNLTRYGVRRGLARSIAWYRASGFLQ